jgi:glycosyltransferase involved in cell wall biosynthesis
MKNPKVSVLIPTYNYGRYLEEALSSVLNQTFSDFEVVIVDNCSTDNTRKVVSAYESDPRVHYYRNDSNIGMVPNFNKSLSYAKGEYIKFLLADDRLHPKQLETFVEILDNYPTVSLVTSSSESFGSHSAIRSAPFTGLQKGEAVIAASLSGGKGNFIGEPTTVMFRKGQLPGDGFDSGLSCLIDLDYWLRLLAVGDCFFVPEVLSYFRVHDQQASTLTNYHNWFDEYKFYRRAYMSDQYGSVLDIGDLKRTVKKTALKSASVMYIVLPELVKRKNRHLFAKAFGIARKEKVLVSSLIVQFNKGKKNRN